MAPDRADDDLDARRKRLGSDLAGRRASAGRAEEKTRASTGTGYAQAVKLSSEFIAAVAVGFALGYGLDEWAGTKPWGMIVFLLLGFCAGVLNVMRSAGVIAQPQERVTRGGKTNGSERRTDGE
ncbi:AtpZ/AtpI family protein [Pararhizobium mangrovi]|uniref:ATP synthase protein I n=1 Tax=Pararhizobium mangrovi TaxID=2590452 RepID=A0A506TXN2_9HYPH|nr:AtpZ/AtpI family protein [Pararhizobium mangrovi]TPW25938.1 F0F1 ATP synthase assembly protein [Pararhizobium mangrovi]